MFTAAGRSTAGPSWEKNAETCVFLMSQAAGEGVSLLVLPEALLVRDDLDPDLSVKSAQPLEGGSLTRLLRESTQNETTTILTIHIPSVSGRVSSILVALWTGQIVAYYARLHPYDAFSIQESRNVDVGDAIAPLLDVDGPKVGLMTYYDLRFLELVLAYALQGAEILILPAAWVRGSLKEHHWVTPLTVGVLDVTCYLIVAGGCGNKNIGQSRVIDPLGMTIAAAAETPAPTMAEVSAERARQVRAQLPVLSNRRLAPP